MELGADATVTITPAAGYYLSDLVVDGSATTPDSVYYFPNVAEDHTLAASFAALSPVETFDHNPVLVPSAANPDVTHDETSLGAWYVGYDWYGPAGFTKASFDGDNRLRLSLSALDFQDPITRDYYNKQGRGYNVATTTVLSADLYVPADWDTHSRYAALWTTALDSAGAETGWPSFKFDTTGADLGFYVWAGSAWNFIGFPGTHGYGEWYNLRVQLNPASGAFPGSVGYYIDDVLVYEDSYAVDTAMASSVGLTSVRLFAWNMGESYDVYWDNVVPVPPAAAYTIDTSAGAGGTISPTATVDWGENATVTVTPDVGYHIADVLVDGASVGAVGSYTFTNVTADHSVAASFAINTFALIYSAGPGGRVSGPPTLADFYSETHLSAVGSWTPLTTSGSGQSFTAIGGTLDSAKFYLRKFGSPTGTAYARLYAHSGTYGSSSLPTGAPLATSAAFDVSTLTSSFSLATFQFDNSVTLTAGEYYCIVVEHTGTDPDNYLQNGYDSATPTHSGNAMYRWGAGSWIVDGSDDIFYVYENAPTITQIVSYNTSGLPVTAIADAGYHFVNWTGYATTTSNPLTDTSVMETRSYTANFAVNTYTITASAGAGGSISPSGAQTVNYGGESATFTITPNAGYHVADVLVDGASVGAVTSYTFTDVTSNHTIAASFAINTYTINAERRRQRLDLAVGCAGRRLRARIQTFTITPDAGYHVADVLVDGASVGAVSELHVHQRDGGPHDRG